MAPFDCTIRFTGLCAFVPNKPLGTPPERMCAVLVDGRKEGTKALDGTVLRRHRGFVLFDVRNLPSAPTTPKNNQGVWYMEDQRIVIDTDGTKLDTSSYNAQIDKDFDIDEPNPGEGTSFSWVAGLTKLMPNFSSIDPNCVSIDDGAAPVPESVLAQIFFDRGTLNVAEPADQVWSFSGALSDQGARQPFAHEVILTLTGVTKLSLIAKALPRAKAEDDQLDLVPGTLGRVDIIIANLCDENPLRWPQDPIPKDDDDFKWHYQLMTQTQQDKIDVQRRGAPLPTPIPERQKVSPNATGVNCFTVRVSDIAFNMP